MADKTKHLPCGHDEKQAQWLGCTEECCRKPDVDISKAYWASKERGFEDDAPLTQRVPRR